MENKIWRLFSQIISYRMDLFYIIKPFFINLNNRNINDPEYIPLLTTFSKSQLEILDQNNIINHEKFQSLVLKNQNSLLSNSNNSNISDNLFKNTYDNPKFEKIISQDNIEQLQNYYNEYGNPSPNIYFIKSFNEVEAMKIPILHYCIQKKAFKCFKYLLKNGKCDPYELMIELNPQNDNLVTFKRYQWDCMCFALYFGENEMTMILEDSGIEIGKISSHLEAVMLSYQNSIGKDIMHKMTAKTLKSGLISCAKNNNIKGVELILGGGVNINIQDINYQNMIILFFIKIIYNK